MSTLDEWVDAACGELGLDPAVADQRSVLDLARVVAHQVDRPAAPVTAFLLGVAVGSGQQLGPAVSQLLGLADRWTQAAPVQASPAKTSPAKTSPAKTSPVSATRRELAPGPDSPVRPESSARSDPALAFSVLTIYL